MLHRERRHIHETGVANVFESEKTREGQVSVVGGGHCALSASAKSFIISIVGDIYTGNSPEKDPESRPHLVRIFPGGPCERRLFPGKRRGDFYTI